MAALVLCATSAMAQKYMKVEYTDGRVFNIPMQYVDKVTPAVHHQPVIEDMTTGKLNLGDPVTVTGQNLDMIVNLGGVTEFTSQTASKITFTMQKAWNASSFLQYIYKGVALMREGESEQMFYDYCELDEPLLLKGFEIASVKMATDGAAVSSADTISVAKGDVYLDIEGENFDRLNEVRISGSGNYVREVTLPAECWQDGMTQTHMTLRIPTLLADGKLTFVFDKEGDYDYKMVQYGYVMNAMPEFTVLECLPKQQILFDSKNAEMWMGYEDKGASVECFDAIPAESYASADDWPWLGWAWDDEHPSYYTMTCSMDEGYLRIYNKFGSYTWLHYVYVDPNPNPDPDPDPNPGPDPDASLVPDSFDFVGEVIWTGDVTIDLGESYFLLSDGGAELQAAGAQVGDIVHFYCQCNPTFGWWCALSEGHWVTEYLNLSNSNWDLAAHGYSLDLVLTQEMLDAAYTIGYWGGTFVVIGDNLVLKAISLEKAAK